MKTCVCAVVVLGLLLVPCPVGSAEEPAETLASLGCKIAKAKYTGLLTATFSRPADNAAVARAVSAADAGDDKR